MFQIGWPTALVLATLLLAVVKIVINECDISASKLPLTEQALSLYGDEDAQRAIDYTKVRRRADSVEIAIRALVVLTLLKIEGFRQLETWVRAHSSGEIRVAYTYLAILALGLLVLGLPFSVYRTFVIESRFGFNRTTPATFVRDRVKGLLIGGLLGSAVIIGLLWIQGRLGDNFWIAAWAVMTVVSVVSFAIGVSVLLPRFNKLQQLPEGELRTKIEEFCASQNYATTRIFTMDGSKRSSKANAFFSGMGKTKTIVLFDTLLERHTDDEIVAVVAHEMAHDRLKHGYQILINQSVQSFLIFALFGWATQSMTLPIALGVRMESVYVALVAFALLFAPINFLSGFFDNWLQRRNEFAADKFSIVTFGGAPMASALGKIGVDSLANPSPHRLFVAAYYSHPPVTQRIARAQALIGGAEVGSSEKLTSDGGDEDFVVTQS
jgi:STE24 endopeptidase